MPVIDPVNLDLTITHQTSRSGHAMIIRIDNIPTGPSGIGRKRQSTNGLALQTLASGRHFSMAGFGRVRSMRMVLPTNCGHVHLVK